MATFPNTIASLLSYKNLGVKAAPLAEEQQQQFCTSVTVLWRRYAFSLWDPSHALVIHFKFIEVAAKDQPACPIGTLAGCIWPGQAKVFDR